MRSPGTALFSFRYQNATHAFSSQQNALAITVYHRAGCWLHPSRCDRQQVLLLVLRTRMLSLWVRTPPSPSVACR